MTTRQTMAKRLNAKTLAGAVIFTTACFQSPAFAETKTYDVAAFTAVKASTGVRVNVTVGEEQSIVAEGPDEEMDRLDIRSEGGKLTIRRTKKKGWGWNWGDSGNFEVTISTPELNSIDISSGVSLDARGIDSARMVLDASSGASMDVSGKCGRLSADASSGSNIDADDLICQEVTADVSSGASIDVHATEKFTGDASSGGSITARGNPAETDSNESSGGSVRVRR